MCKNTEGLRDVDNEYTELSFLQRLTAENGGTRQNCLFSSANNRN